MKLNRISTANFGVFAVILIMISGCSLLSDYPITRQVGHVDWEVVELSAKFEHENFNVFNNKSYIVIKAKLKLPEISHGSNKIERLFVERQYISEDVKNILHIQINPIREGRRFNNKKFFTKRKIDKIDLALIKITPLFTRNTDKGKTTIDLTIEEPIQNRSWGRNYYRVKIGDKQIDLGTFQAK